MIYAMGDIPVGAYDPTRLSNIGIGHGAIDGGVGYTYFDPTKGHEFSAVAGFTYNSTNTSTNYQNGVDFYWTGALAVSVPTVFYRSRRLSLQSDWV